MAPNSKIPDLRKEIAHWQKETTWKQNAAASIRCTGSGPCKSRIAHLNDAQKYRERVAGLQQKLAREPAMVKQPIYAEHSYAVTMHTWALAQPIAIEIRSKGGKTIKTSMVPERATNLIEHPAQPKLGLAGTKPSDQSADSLRGPLHSVMAGSAEYLVHNNLGPRNDAIVAKVTSSKELERAEWIATYLVVNPKANADNITFANRELSALAKISSGGTNLAKKVALCWKRP